MASAGVLQWNWYGLRYALLKAGVNATVVQAFDINDLANDVYQHKFRHRPFQGNIQTLNAADLDGYISDVSRTLDKDSRKAESTMNKEQLQSPEYWDELLQDCQPVNDFLAFKTFGNDKGSSTYSFHANDSVKSDISDKENNVYFVPSSLIERWVSAMDIVYPHSKRCCFTKSYYRYVKGTGSLLATVQEKTENRTPSLQDVSQILHP
ncbi:hypothetical protein T459_16634 [Capsicum annuum]|uniref:Uncharacterized protein n=1 Tax=Capsicum annuum TaxID=4072 RepID=A0A2G2Z993_CAPAN|nr:hypothetical protein T459_16634 [Capsicum annuum]